MLKSRHVARLKPVNGVRPKPYSSKGLAGTRAPRILWPMKGSAWRSRLEMKAPRAEEENCTVPQRSEDSHTLMK